MNQWDKVAADIQYPFKSSMVQEVRKYRLQTVPIKRGLFPKAVIAQKRVQTL